MLMVVLALIIVGLCLGSFANALVWRLHEQAKVVDQKKPDKKYLARLSLMRGRSMCTHCHHELKARDLIPVFSWLRLKGKCHYCGKPIDDSPLIELSVPVLFVASYVWWPTPLSSTAQTAIFSCWLALVVGLIALVVYDLRWMLLPNRLIYPLLVLATVEAVISILTSERPLWAVINTALAVLVGGGIFYLLFQVSAGRWIGGGDVRLGWLLGLMVATPARSLLFIFIAALSGSLISLPLLVNGRLKRTSTIPFGPFLIAGAIIVQLFGASILTWYEHIFLATS